LGTSARYAVMQFDFEDLVAVMARLRDPGGCPWDREQTHATLAPYLLEEAHEVLEAISRGDQAALRGELGDLLLQVVFHAQMAREAGGFNAGDVIDGLVRKLIDRHPHVFGDVRLDTAGEVLAQWHEIKRRETPERGPFDGVPKSLPALARAQKLLGRAADTDAPARVPSDPAQALVALRERVRSIAPARARGAASSRSAAPAHGKRATGSPIEGRDLGELLLAVVALAAAAEVDAESALRAACDEFVQTTSAQSTPTAETVGTTAGDRRRSGTRGSGRRRQPRR